GVVLAHLPVPFVLAHDHTTAGGTGLALAVMAAADLAAWTLLDSRHGLLRDVRRTVLVAGSITAVLAVLIGALGAFADGEGLGTAALVAMAAISATAGFIAAPE